MMSLLLLILISAAQDEFAITAEQRLELGRLLFAIWDVDEKGRDFVKEWNEFAKNERPENWKAIGLSAQQWNKFAIPAAQQFSDALDLWIKKKLQDFSVVSGGRPIKRLETTEAFVAMRTWYDEMIMKIGGMAAPSEKIGKLKVDMLKAFGKLWKQIEKIQKM